MQYQRIIISLATIFTFCLLSVNLLAQNTGFGGKRLVFKATAADGIHGALTGGSAEWVLDKAFTLQAGFNRVGYQVKPVFNGSSSGIDNKCAFDHQVPETQVQSRSFYIEPRLYILDSDFTSAPNGSFGYAQLKGGTKDLDGFYNIGILHRPVNCRQNEEIYSVEFEYQNLKFVSSEFGFGYQHFFTPWLSTSIKGGLDINVLFVEGDSRVREVIKGNNSQLGSNMVELNPGLWGIGLSAYIEVGVMPF